jgi:hypothetical protein
MTHHVVGTVAVAPTLAAYRHAVRTARLALDRLTAGSITRHDVASLQATLRALGRVRLPDGRLFQTDTPRLARKLAVDPPSVRTVARQVDDLDTALRHAASLPARPAQLHVLDLVLRDPRFHPTLTPLQRLASLLSRLLPPVIPSLPVPLPSALIAVLFLLLLLAAALLLARGSWSHLVAAGSLSPPTPHPAPAAEAARQAAQHAARADYRGALRYRFLSTMLALQDRGVIELEPGLTNREYLARLRSAPGVAIQLEAPLLALVDLFDRVWYGHQPLDAAGYARAEELARTVVSAARREAAA